MCDASFIADVAVLPRWIKVSQLLDYVAGVHPRFDRAKAEGFLARTEIKRTSKIRQLSKGMVAQLHLALVMAIDAKLLVLDEPTLGLDILYRKQFYDTLLNDYFDKTRTIVVTTHQVEEIQDVLTDLMFIDRGRIVLECSMEEFDARYLEVMVNPEKLAEARALKPIHERPVFGRSVLLFDGANREHLETLGEVRRPSIADLFVATMGSNKGGGTMTMTLFRGAHAPRVLVSAPSPKRSWFTATGKNTNERPQNEHPDDLSAFASLREVSAEEGFTPESAKMRARQNRAAETRHR